MTAPARLSAAFRWASTPSSTPRRRAASGCRRRGQPGRSISTWRCRRRRGERGAACRQATCWRVPAAGWRRWPRSVLVLRAFQGPTTVQAFDSASGPWSGALRAPERSFLPGRLGQRRGRGPTGAGRERTFKVLKYSRVRGTSSTDYVHVTGTTKYVGQQVAIFLDDAAPTTGYTQADIDQVGSASTTISIPSTPPPSAANPTSTATAWCWCS